MGKKTTVRVRTTEKNVAQGVAALSEALPQSPNSKSTGLPPDAVMLQGVTQLSSHKPWSKNPDPDPRKVAQRRDCTKSADKHVLPARDMYPVINFHECAS
jgi:hypothetical protein